MPALTPDDRRALLGPIGRVCIACGEPRVRHYCRSCDEFVFRCRCLDELREHAAHRVYMWTARGEIALPDFDRLLER
jgi:hypothetical protein